MRGGARNLLAAGGDGTAFEVVNGLLQATGEEGAAQVGLGLVPLGTGNSFLRDLGVADLPAALAKLGTGEGRRVDVMRFSAGGQRGWALNLLGVGFIADVCALANRRFKGLGGSAYALATVGELASLAPRRLQLEVDGRALAEESFCSLSVCNSQFTGGTMRMAPLARVDDGELDVVVVGAMGRLELLRTFPKLYSGEHLRHPRVRTFRARQVRISCEPKSAVMPDGEVLGATPLSCQVVPGALRLLA